MLSDNIRNLRKAKGWSQEELAVKVNVVRQTVSKWEKGLSVPDSEMLIRIAGVLDTSVGTLLGENVELDGKPQEDINLKEIAAKMELLNEQFTRHNERQRRIWRTFFVSLGVLVILAILHESADFFYRLAAMNAIRANSAIIGGYDGPTNIYVSGISFKAGTLFLTLIGAAISGIGIYKTRKR